MKAKYRRIGLHVIETASSYNVNYIKSRLHLTWYGKLGFLNIDN